MRSIIILFSFIIFCSCNPGVRLTISENYVNSFIKEQLPNLLPKSLFIPEISKNTTHANFVANITSVSIKNLDMDYLRTSMSLNAKDNKLYLTITNFNIDLDFDYLFRALFLHNSGHFTLQNNITLNLEVSSSYDQVTQKPILNISSISVNYNTFNILFGGSIFSYILDIIEGFCDCVVKEQYPNLVQSVLGLAFDTAISQINNKFLIDLNFTKIGLDLSLSQEIENNEDHINIYSNFVFYDPYEPFMSPPLPSPLPIYNTSHPDIEIAINQGVINSLFWTLNNQKIFDLVLKGDNLPVEIPIPLEIDTKLFELALPEFYNYYGSNKIIDLHLNTTNGSQPIFSVIELDSSLGLKINETIGFFVRLDNDQLDQAFTVSFSFDLKAICSLNESFVLLEVIQLSNTNIELIQNKIPGLQIEALSKMIDSFLSLFMGFVNTYLKTHPIPTPTLPGVELKNLELLVKDENLILAVKPVLNAVNEEIIKDVITVVKERVQTIRV